MGRQREERREGSIQAAQGHMRGMLTPRSRAPDAAPCFQVLQPQRAPTCSSTVGFTTKPRPGSRPTRAPATALRSGTSAGGGMGRQVGARERGRAGDAAQRHASRAAVDASVLCTSVLRHLFKQSGGHCHELIKQGSPEMASAAPAAVMASGSGECFPS